MPVNCNQRYNAYLKEIADLCNISKHLTTHTARHTFSTTVTLENDVPIETVTYFHLGRMIVEEEQQGQERAAYAESVLVELSRHLTKEYGKGFSHRNLDYFREVLFVIYESNFAITDCEILHHSQYTINTQSLILFSEKFKLSWTHISSS